MKALIIGRGQLGSAVFDALSGADTVRETPWADPGAAADHVADAVRAFTRRDGPKCILWCAGAGIVGTGAEALTAERAVLERALSTVNEPGAIDRFFLASSAGGLYAGNTGLCTEQTEPIPTSDYGRSKLIQEAMVTDWADATRTPVLIGRISNLYGPRQNASKPQGFITHLLLSMQRQRPFVYTVPSSTLRDFVYTDDVARRVARWAESPQDLEARVDVKILGADQSMSLGHVATLASRVTRRPSRVLFTRRPGVQQPAAVRIRSTATVPGLPAGPTRSLELGLWQTWQALLRADRLGR